jgi:ADP-heptose:LPS heptosyltransferase
MLARAPKDTLFYLTANGCAETAKVFNSFASDRVQVFTEKENTFFQKPHARAFRLAAKAGADYLGVMNDDIVVPEKFLELLSAPMESNPSVAITGPEGNCQHLDHNFHGGGGSLEYIECSCALIRISAIRRLRQNLWCPDLSMIYGEDSSLSLFVRENGYSIQTVPMNVEHTRSVTVNSNPETKRRCQEAQDRNHKVNARRWEHYLKARRFDYPIIIKRTYAIGDVILTTPIIRAIKQSNPLSPIFVQTNYPEVFANNPDVQQAAKEIPSQPDALVVDLDNSYESMPQTHIVDAYHAKAKEVVRGMGKPELKTFLHPSKQDLAWARNAKERFAPTQKLVLINADPSDWPGKQWGADNFLQIAKWLQSQGFVVATIGTKTHYSWNGVIDLVGMTSLLQLAALCTEAALVVTTDSMPLHVAQAMGAPVACVYGATNARFIATQGSKHSAAEADPKISCAGSRHRSVGQTFVPCSPECIQSVTVDDVKKAIERLKA